MKRCGDSAMACTPLNSCPIFCGGNCRAGCDELFCNAQQTASGQHFFVQTVVELAASPESMHELIAEVKGAQATSSVKDMARKILEIFGHNLCNDENISRLLAIYFCRMEQKAGKVPSQTF